MNPKLLWLPTYNLHKIKPICILAWREERLKPPHLTGELLGFDGFQLKKNQLSLRVLPLVDQPHFSKWFHTLEYMGKQIGLGRLLKKQENVREEMGRG